MGWRGVFHQPPVMTDAEGFQIADGSRARPQTALPLDSQRENSSKIALPRLR
jgi:hypothetical protein